MEKIKAEETNILKMAEGCIRTIKPAMERIRQFVVENPFISEAHEIQFFREVKPQLGSKLIYYLALYRIESRRPIGSLEARLTYLQMELQKIDQSFAYHQEFYHYYRSGGTFLDEMYFVRGRQDLHFLLDMDWLYSDPAFSTGYDFLVSKMKAHEQLIS